MQDIAERQYVGFWMRLWATIVDTVLLSLVILPLLFYVYGKDYLALPSSELGLWYYLLVWVMPAIVVMLFWFACSATPGKIIIGARIIDFKSGNKPKFRQDIIRYIGYFISTFVFMLGFLWIAVDDYKQGWHDKLAATAVVYEIRSKATTAILLILSVIGVLAFFIGSYLMLWNLVNTQLTELHDVTTGQYIAEGFQYGGNVSTTECWNQTLRRIDTCDDIRCKINQTYFLKACMGASYATTQSYR